jgi:uroporphyrinogen decarboxylase
MLGDKQMTNRERFLAVLGYKDYDRMPVIHFGFWDETREKWRREGHLTDDEAKNNMAVGAKLGFDFGIHTWFSPNYYLSPVFEGRLVESFPDGSRHVFCNNGTTVLLKPGVTSIPKEIDHTLKDRESWEKEFKWRLQYSEDRIDFNKLEGLKNADKTVPLSVFGGSFYGVIRNWCGVEGLCYLQADDEELYTEIIDTLGNLTCKLFEKVLGYGIKFDFANIWEDICFNTGPLVNPTVFREKVGPHYRRMADLCNGHGMDVVSLDCDGKIDELVPVWLENGVNTMFPIEVGTWGGSVEPWREKYGKGLLGVGGMDKRAFAADFDAVDAEIERLKPLIGLGGYVPCPDHLISPDAIWENVAYYCKRMREEF